MAATVRSVAQIGWRQNRRIGLIVIAGTMVAAGFGVVAAKLATGGLSALHIVNPPSWPGGIVVFPLLLLLPVAWRWPRACLVALLAGSTLIDQFQYTIVATANDGTTSGKVHEGWINVPLFRSLSKGSFVTPAETLLFILLLIWLLKGALKHSWDVPRSSLAKAMAVMFGLALVLGLGLGTVHHGNIKISLWELRPWYYLAVTFLLTSSFFKDRDVVRPLLWTIVLGSGLKSVEGVVNYFTIARKMTPRPDAILSHEESFFFAIFLLTTIALWIFQVRGPLRKVATALSPLVVIADLGNARRTASLLIYVGLAALLVVAYVAMPERRRMLKKLNVVLVILGALYLGAFWNSSGTLGQPARAVHSAIAPNARDLSSDQYRVVENANLIQGIHSTRSVGKGFGTPINYGFATIVNLTSIDSMIAYIPHNGVLYVWYRLGIAGEIALWSIVGFGILAGSRLAKHQPNTETGRRPSSAPSPCAPSSVGYCKAITTWVSPGSASPSSWASCSAPSKRQVGGSVRRETRTRRPSIGCTPRSSIPSDSTSRSPMSPSSTRSM